MRGPSAPIDGSAIPAAASAAKAPGATTMSALQIAMKGAEPSRAPALAAAPYPTLADSATNEAPCFRATGSAVFLGESESTTVTLATAPAEVSDERKSS